MENINILKVNNNKVKNVLQLKCELITIFILYMENVYITHLKYQVNIHIWSKTGLVWVLIQWKLIIIQKTCLKHFKFFDLFIICTN